MNNTPWTATMIASSDDFSGAPLLRKSFTLDAGHGDVMKATLRATAFGVYEAFVNGHPVSEQLLSPGWSSYEWRLRYQSYDVTALLEPESVLGVALGNGWYRGHLGFNGGSRFYGEELGFFGQLGIEFSDGHTQTVTSDTSWLAGASSTLSNDIYNGQTIDGRLADEVWKHPAYEASTDSARWVSTRALEFDTQRLTPPVSPPVKRQEAIKPVSVFQSPAGKTLVDFGQNLVGWIRFTIQGPAGRKITLRHAEVLEDGELGTRPLRDARATDTLILSGGQDFFEPTMTFHGFRYAEVEGWPAELTTESLEAVVVHTELQRIGHFECSNELLNQLHRNAVWGLKGNFLDVPTDCPQRNERLGWTGDIAVFSPTATFLYDVKDFLQDWLLDLSAEQVAADGMVPFIVPDILKYEDRPKHFPAPESTAIWSEAAVWVPWALWEAYGDVAVLREQFGSMAAHTRRVEGLLSATGLWDTGFQFGDWLDPDAPSDSPAAAKANKGVVATACMYRTAVLTAKAAEILGRSDDAAHFSNLAQRVKDAFNNHYVDPAGTILSDCTTVYSLAIVFDVLENPDLVRAAGQRLAELVRKNNYRVSTGFAGTPFITWALSMTGHTDDAYKLLLEEGCPSWLYPVKMGATTIWERWDSMRPDGSINPGEMTSFNHYALGAVADWMHKVIGGLSPAEPGYSKIRIAPRPGDGVNSAHVSLDSPHGYISVSWQLTPDGILEVEATIPELVEAEVTLPGGDPFVVGPGQHAFSSASLSQAGQLG